MIIRKKLIFLDDKTCTQNKNDIGWCYISVSIIMLWTLNGFDMLHIELLARNTLSSNYSLFYNGNCIVTGGTFALYSLICRYAKVSLTPNQQAEDKEVSNYRLDVPNRRLKRASFIKSMLESNQILKYFVLFMTTLGTSMVIGEMASSHHAYQVQ